MASSLHNSIPDTEWQATGYTAIPLAYPIFHPDGSVACSCRSGKHCGKKTGKHPTIKEWTQVRMTHWPARANVGLLCGEAHGLLVIECDPRNGGRLDALPLDIAPTVKSGGGGFHFYFKYPRGVSLSGAQARLARAGIVGWDVKLSGLVVAPPSVHLSGKHYEWVDGFPRVDDLPEVPPEVLSLLVNFPIREATPKPGHFPILGSGEYRPIANFWLGKAIHQATPGQRHTIGLNLAVQLHAHDVPLDEAEGVMGRYAAHAHALCEEAYTKEEALSSLRWVYTHPALPAVFVGFPTPPPTHSVSTNKLIHPVRDSLLTAAQAADATPDLRMHTGKRGRPASTRKSAQYKAIAAVWAYAFGTTASPTALSRWLAAMPATGQEATQFTLFLFAVLDAPRLQPISHPESYVRRCLEMALGREYHQHRQLPAQVQASA
jgi:hypothetical protein